MFRELQENYPVTAVLLLLVVGLYALEGVAQEKLAAFPEDVNFFNIGRGPLRLLGGLTARSVVEERELWRLLSSCFLHGGVVHILFNGWVLYDLGRFCEPLLSPYKFLSVYVLCGLGGSIASCAWKAHTGTDRVSIGASGALLGLIGMLLVFSHRERIAELKQFLIRWIVVIVVMSVFLARMIDHGAHIGGFATGALLGLSVRRYTTSAEADRWRIPSYVLGGVTALCLVLGVWNYFEFLRASS